MSRAPARAGRPDGAGPKEEVLCLLETGHVELKGRIPWSSNATFLAEVSQAPGRPLLAIYKPARGERPLWDFPRGLWRREVAAYELSKWLGWDLVPPTVERHDAPLGPGSLQYWVEAEADEHYFTLLEAPEHASALRRVAVFDLVANNADRKAGHLLLDRTKRVWAIDHGLCFHVEPKLRTVMWDFAGEEIGADLLSALRPLASGSVPATVARHLQHEEVKALVLRARSLERRGKFPAPKGRWPYPWPLV